MGKSASNGSDVVQADRRLSEARDFWDRESNSAV